MKRSDMKYELMSLLLNSPNIDIPTSTYMDEERLALEIIEYIEDIGMLPPPQTCNIIYDEKGPKHNEATRQWDNE